MKTRYAITLPVFLFLASLHAQRFEHVSFTEVVSNYANASSGASTIFRDLTRDLVIGGDFAENFISGTDTVFPVAPGNGDDLYIAKFHADGTPMWITRFGGTWYDDVYTVRTDIDGNIIVSAYIQTGATVYEDTTVTNATEKSIIKLDPDGNLVWQHFITGNQKTGLAVIGRSIYYTYDGNCIGKLDAGGNLVWTVVPSTGAGNIYFNNLVATSSGQLVGVTPSGTFPGVVTYGSEAINLPDVNHGYYLRMDTNGTAIGSAVFGPTALSYYDRTPAAVDTSDNVYLLAKYNGTITIGATTMTSVGGINAFEAKYGANDQAAWATAITSAAVEVGGIAHDASLQKIFVSGWYSTALDMGNGISLPAAFNGDGYLITCSALDGTPVAADHWGGGAGSDLGYELTSDDNGMVYGVGLDYAPPSTFRCRTYANRTGGVLFAYSQGSDAVAQVAITPNGNGLFAAPVAANIQWFFNGDTIPGATTDHITMDQVGTYSVVTTNAYGCSSTAQFSWDVIGEGTVDRLSVHPVPASSIVWIDRAAGSAEDMFELYDAMGARVRTLRCGVGRSALDVSTLPASAYVLRAVGSAVAAARIVVVRE